MKNFKILEPVKKNLYEIILKEDTNDGDYIPLSFTINEEDFESDELLQLVLCYCNIPSTYSEARFGHHFNDNKELPWLEEYLDNSDLIVHGEMGPAHSITNITITYYDLNSIAHPVELYSIDIISKDIKDLLDKMTNLYQHSF